MEYHVKNLQRIFDEARFSPVFRENPKYNIDGVARIDYDDIMNDRCIIKADKNFPDSGSFWVGKGAEIIAQYKSVQDLVDDGWRLD